MAHIRLCEQRRWCSCWGRPLRADLPPEQYAHRPGRNDHDAFQQGHRLLKTGHTQVVDADLAADFDSIPHAELMKSVGASDRRSARAASDQDVAGSVDRGDRRAGSKEAYGPAS